ncbi:PorP/SprF family type IX secretion system membrane protein [Ekhidna sp.]
MIKKVIFFITIFSVLCQENTLKAQDPQFSQYYAAPLYLNPGLVGINQKGRMGINYRTQWPNLDANFETFSAYADYHFEDYFSSAGIIFTRDQEGIAGLNSTSIGLQYAYQLQINYDWTFRAGVQGAYVIRDLNFDKLTFGDQFDNTGLVRPVTGEVFNTGLNAKFFDLSFGGILYNPSIWIGAALHHVLEPNQSIAGGDAPLPRRFSIHGGYRISLNPGSRKTGIGERSITPTFNYRTQGNFDQLDVGAYFTLSPVLVGLWYRGLPIKNLDGITNNESIILMLGLQTNRATFGYSFDYTLSDLGIGTGGAHEISIAYSFSLGDPLKPAADVRRLRCPIPFIF